MARSGDFVWRAVATAVVVNSAVGSGGLRLRFVMEPANTPPATGSGAPAKPMPLGSTTLIVPAPEAPAGALANHGRPKPLFKEMPSGRLTDGRSAVTAAALFFPFRNCGLCAVYRMTAPPAANGCPVEIVGGDSAGSAKSAGTCTAPLETSSERIDPGASVGLASGAPKLDVLATSKRVRSRTGWLADARAPPRANGPPL